MRYILLYFAILLCALPAGISARGYEPDRTGKIFVADLNGNALPNAHVTIACGPDTLRGSTHKQAAINGVRAVYACNRVFSDSVTLRVSYVGFKPFEDRFPAEAINGGIWIYMEEEEREIGQIIIVGNRAAMVIKGDTTIYNADSFGTMTGDRFMELVRQLPGVEIRNNKIYAQGEEIKRVYVDGKNLFGLNAGYALTDLEAAEVRNVKIYDEENALAKSVGDRNPPKERVMDVITYSKRDVIQGGKAGALLGVSTERDYSDKHEIRHSEAATLYRNTEKGNLRMELGNTKDAGGGEQAANASKITPFKAFKTRLMQEYRRGDSTWIMTFAHFERGKTRMTDAVTTDYFSSPQYASRTVEARQEDNDRSWGIAAGNQTVLRRKKSMLSAMFNFKYDDLWRQAVAATVQQLDDRVTRTNLSKTDDNRKYDLDATLVFDHYFSAKTSLNAQFVAAYGNTHGSGWNVDTLASDKGLRVLLDNELRGPRLNVVASCEAGRQTGDRTRVSACYAFRYNRLDSKRTATDFLHLAQGVPDPVNTHDFTVNSLWHTLSGKWAYNRDHTRLEAVIEGSLYEVNRAERFPAYESVCRRFILFNPSLAFSTGKPSGRLDARFDLSSQDLQPEILGMALDASDPLFLKAGNPGLKPTNTARFDVSYTSTNGKNARSVSFGLTGIYNFNYIAVKQTLFKEQTRLSRYDYTAQQGAQLATFVNIDGRYELRARMNYAQRSAALKSTIRIGVEYGFENTPYFLAERRYESRKQAMSLKIGFNSGFSSKVRIGIRSTTDLGVYTTQNGKSRYVKELLTGNFDASIGAGFFTALSCVYELYRNDKSSLFKQDDLLVDAEAGYRFGKNRRFAIAAGAANLFDQVSWLKTLFAADYIRTSRISYLGRYGYLRIQFEF
ncbi:carboxypeptidase-like regulatory domain-containing protein [Alistipes sp.]|uniref:carboxypeptidase-like regulatory domain-containing protein n=1 Tax=Alistipes sp. TaxID=1872444 RepID=UPI003AF0794D